MSANWCRLISLPSAAWTSQQIVEAFADRDAPQYLIRDRDSIYSDDVSVRISSMGIEEVLTAPRSPWQNPYVERLIGSVRRDCLNHFVILNARHLKRALASYFGYYQRSRTHLGDSKSNVHSLGRCRAQEGLSQSLRWAACITAMYALQRNDMGADAVLANDRIYAPTARAPALFRPKKRKHTTQTTSTRLNVHAVAAAE